MAKLTERHMIAERSAITKFRKEIWAPFVAAVKKYRLIGEGDKIAVCISGGKDSMLMAKLMQQLQRYSKVRFEVVYLVMDPGYNANNRQKIESNALLLQVPITVFETDIFKVADNTERNPCYLCARMRRGHLYAKAKELGCNKIALGHHMSDVIETTLMGMIYGAQLQGMLPRIKSTNFAGMELIRPMYEILENDIIRWRDYNKLDFIACACSFTERVAVSGDKNSARECIKTLLKQIKEMHPDAEKNILKSIHNIKLDTLGAYKIKGEERSFLDNFED